MTKAFAESEGMKELAEKALKSEDDDPLLRAMKNELTSRMLGGSPSSTPIKKEDFEDPYAMRNSGSPMSNGDKFAAFGLLPNNYNVFREPDVDNQWFSILPKESCDPNTLLLGKNESDKLTLPLNLPSRGGLPPSPGPLPPCDSPAPLILSQEESAMLEQLKKSGPRPPATPKTIPKGIFRINDEREGSLID